MTVPFIRLDGVRPSSKKRAKEIKARLSSFGIDINLSRSYEILASLSGYRNWATMSASEPEADGSFLLGFQIGGDQFSSDISHWALKRIEIPFSVAKNHIEVIGNGYPATPSLLALAQSAMEQGSPVVLLSANIGVLQTAKISDATGRQDFTARFIGTYEEAPRYEPLNYLSPDEVSGFMNVLSVDYVGSNHEYWTARITWLAKVAAMLVGPSASVEEFTDSMKLENLIRVFQADETADDLRDEVGDYLKSIPRFDPAAKEQNEIARDQHGYVAMRSWALLHPSSKQGVGVKEAQLRKPPFSISPFEEALNGGVVHVHYQKRDENTDFNLLPILLADLSARMHDRGAWSAPPVVLIDNAEDVAPEVLDEILNKFKGAGVVCVIASKNRLTISSLKSATTIEVSGWEARYLTPTQSLLGQAPDRLNERPAIRVPDTGQYFTYPVDYRALLS